MSVVPKFPVSGEPPEVHGGRVGDVTLESIGDTLGYAAGAIDGLRQVLERLNGSTLRAQEERLESRMGRLFTQAEEFADAALADARQQAEDVIGQARFEAERMLDTAREEAEHILHAAKEEAERIGLAAERMAPPRREALNELESTVALFNQMSSELSDGLSELVEGLSQRSRPPDGPSSTPQLPAAELPGTWMDDDAPLWETPNEHHEPRRRFWQRRG